VFPQAQSQEQFFDCWLALVEITVLLTLVNLDRFSAAFGIRSAGFSAGMVCLLPDRPAGTAISADQLS
jgi:hypothetical protein